MAATTRLSTNLITATSSWWTTSNLALSSRLCPVVVQVRHKQLKQTRLRAPPEPKAREKWIKTSKASAALLVKPKVQMSAEFLARVPTDDVWVRCNYPRQHLSLEQCLIRHQENADPSMADNMEGFVYADMELDMRTSKKTKFLSGVRGTLLLPHVFEQPSNKQKIAVFCKKEEDVQLAKSLGADFVGGENLVKEIQEGIVDRDDIDVVICLADAITDMIPIRATLRDKFPSKARGNVGSDLEPMWKLYTQGVSYSSQKLTDAVSRLQVPLGPMKLKTEQLAENFMTFVSTLCKGRAKNLGPLITEVVFVAPPSFERFTLKVADYVPGHEKKTIASQADEDEDSDEEEEARRQ